MTCFRFMDWMHTNGSKIETWSDRPTLDSATFSKKGVALEWMIDLYIACNARPGGKGKLNVATVPKWTVDQALDYMETESLPKSIRAIQASKQVADKYGLVLTAYEGGQHMVGVGGGENNKPMEALFHACNAHARMGTIYAKYLAAWTAAGGDLFCNFSSVGRWSKWGSWGVMQYYDDDPAKAYKFASLMRWAAKCGQKVNALK